MLDPFTIKDGVLVMDEGRGPKHGPRVIDPAAGVVRFEDPQHTVPIADLRAIAVVYVERDMSHRVVRSTYEIRPTMVLSVVLVTRRPSKEVDELFAALERHAGVPVARPADESRFSMVHAGAAVDAVSIPLFNGADAAAKRSTGKAVARLTRLPLVELYGEYCVYRPADRLDLQVREQLQKAQRASDPGAPPWGIQLEPGQQGFAISWKRAPGATKAFMILAAIALLFAIPLVLVAPPAGIGMVILAVVVFVIALRSRTTAVSRMVIGDDSIRVPLAEGRHEDVAIDALEMLRVVDRTVVLVAQRDETRCELPSPEAASWARSAIEHHLARGGGAPYRSAP